MRRRARRGRLPRIATVTRSFITPRPRRAHRPLLGHRLSFSAHFLTKGRFSGSTGNPSGSVQFPRYSLDRSPDAPQALQQSYPDETGRHHRRRSDAAACTTAERVRHRDVISPRCGELRDGGGLLPRRFLFEALCQVCRSKCKDSERRTCEIRNRRRQFSDDRCFRFRQGHRVCQIHRNACRVR